MDGFGSLWASMASWFTPSVLFCVLNVVIGTIVMASRFKTHHQPDGGEHHQPDGGEHHQPPPQPQLVRPPSFLERLRSFNLSVYNSDPPETLPPDGGGEHNRPPQLGRVTSLLVRLRSFNVSVYNSDPPETLPPDGDGEHHPPPQLGRAPSFLARLRSFNLSFNNSDRPPETLQQAEAEPPLEDHDHPVRRRQPESSGEVAAFPERTRVEEKRPATARVRNQTAAFREDEAVDARADDFISRFRQQLKLQRLDSFIRYRDMLNRGT